MHSSDGLHIRAGVVPWDTAAFGVRVASIDAIDITPGETVDGSFEQFELWRDQENIDIVSCRLHHEKLNESMFLESRGFRFIEMVLHPYFDDIQERARPDHAFTVVPAAERDLDDLQHIAGSAFGHERFHVDPRLDATFGDRRYASWVGNSFKGSRQELLKVTDGHEVIGFFVVEYRGADSVYWHLNAISSNLQGKGLGRRAWLSMIDHHRDQGRSRIDTTISARNVRVINLYASLGSKFLPPHTTFHGVRHSSEICQRNSLE